MKWEQDEQTGKWGLVKGNGFRLEWSRVAPFDAYPSPSSKDMNDGYLFERHRLRRADLVAMKGVPGYNDAAIDLVLEAYGRGGLREWLWRDQERAWLEKRPNEWLNYDDTMDALEFWGSVSGRLLVEWGMSPDKVTDLNEEYEINAWMIGSYVVRAVINEDPLGHRPYDKCSFEEIPGAFWGLGVPEIMKDVQDICQDEQTLWVHHFQPVRESAFGNVGKAACIHFDGIFIESGIVTKRHLCMEVGYEAG